MSKRTITLLTCDRCKKEGVEGAQSLFVQTGWAPCPAGGPAESDGEDIDLCPPCLAKAAAWWLKNSADFNVNKKFLKDFIK